MREKSLAETLIRRHGTNDPFLIAEKYSTIQVYRVRLALEVRGFYQYYKRNRIIYINSSLDHGTRKIVCAHELGHALQHTKMNTCFFREYTLFSVNKYEAEANRFAAELLLPDTVYGEYPGWSIWQIAHELGYDDMICEYKTV